MSWQYSLAAVCEGQSTNCLMFGLAGSEIDAFLESLRETVGKENFDESVIHVIIPTVLVEIAMDSLAKDAEERRASLLQICYATGLHGFHTSSMAHERREEEALTMDVLIHKLTGLLDACSGIQAVCKMQFRFLEAIRQLTRQTCDMKKGGPQACMQQLGFIEELLHGIESKIGYTEASARGQVQTLYSLIAQRESRTNIQYAEASSSMADQSRKIAELTRQDSIDMRIITAITLIFLPGTFTATLFSTTFFSFQPRSPSHVSNYLWLYFVVTVILTALALVGWVYFARQQTKKTERIIRRETWREKMEAYNHEETDKQTGFKPRQRMASLALQPYLSGDTTNLKFANEGGDIFNKPVELEDLSPKRVVNTVGF